MQEDLDVPEKTYYPEGCIAILRYDDRHYDAKIIGEFFEADEPFIVKDIKLTIPRSHVVLIGETYFGKFLAAAFKLMSKPSCEGPLSVLKPLRKKLRRLKRKMLRINPNNPALGWYLENLYSMIKEMWLGAKKNYLSWLVEKNLIKKDAAILDAGILF